MSIEKTLELENFVLGSLMANPALFPSISELFSPEMFFNPVNRAVADVMIRLQEKNIQPDTLAILPYIKNIELYKSADIATHVLKLSENHLFINPETIDVKCKMLYEVYLRRKGEALAEEFKLEISNTDNDIFDLFGSFSDSLVKTISIKKENESPIQRLNMAIEKSYKAHQQGNGVSGLSFGMKALDKLGGASGGDLIIIAGYPGTFKTGLTMQIADNFCANKTPVLFFEMEMSQEQFGMRELAMHSGLSTHDIKVGNVNELNYDLLKQKAQVIAARPFYVDFRSGLTISAIKNKSRIYKAKKNIGAVIIDYLGLANLELRKYGGLEPAIDNFVRECKALAKSLDIPVILLAQFLKDNQGDKLKMPHSGLLKGSGAIEAHADIVLLTWNPSAVDENFEFNVYGTRQLTRGLLGIVAAKNRQGSSGLGWVKAFPAVNRFQDIETEVSFTQPLPNEKEDMPFESTKPNGSFLDSDELPF